MNPYIQEFTEIIRNGSMENTYKMSWARALVELCVKDPQKHLIEFKDIGKLMFQYYWDQTIFFNLEQGPNLKKRPALHQIVLEKINQFRKTNLQPIKFIRTKEIEIPVNEISKILTQDVSHRFLKVGNQQKEIYNYTKGETKLELHHPNLINEHSQLLFELINYRWSQKLEDLNNSPRIAQKVRGTDRDEVPRRSSLKKFHQYLDYENPNHICFFSGEKISKEDLSIDHIIPWSFMYSDDLWNLVYVKKSLNSSMSNKTKNNAIKKKLIYRNKQLLEKLIKNNVSNKIVDELKLSIEKDYVEQFWISALG